MNTLSLLLPDLSLIVIGYLLSRPSIWPRSFWAGLEMLVYYVLFPALLFQSVLTSTLSLGQAVPALTATGVALAGCMAMCWLAKQVLSPDPRQFASGVQCGFRFSTYVALALAQRLGGDAGVALCAVLVGFVVPAVNIAAVYALAHHGGANVWREVLRNPLVLATLGGLLGNALGLTLPAPVGATVSRLGAAALAAGLLTVGAGLIIGRQPGGASTQDGDGDPGAAASRGADRNARRLAIWLTATKLVWMPAIALAWVTWRQLPALHGAIVVMFCAMPTASSCYILAVRMGGDGPYVARLVTLSMLGGLFTLPLWVAWVRAG